MSVIKAIETRYAGCHFRSRLEARWAVFFDALGIPWEYEPQGFDMEGVRYLPDFYLPSMHSYFEIKGELNARDVKWRRFHEEVNGAESWQIVDFIRGARDDYPVPATERTFMLGGIPRLTPHSGDTHEAASALGPGSPHSGWAFTMCYRCSVGRDVYDMAHCAFPTVMSCGHPFDPGDDSFYMTALLEDAYNAARSARFEHGESGAT